MQDSKVKATPTKRLLSRLEVGLLLGLLIFLPLYEAPKNLMLYLFLLVWAWRSYTEHSWGLGVYWFEWPLFALALLSLLSNLLTPFDFLLTLRHSTDFYSIILIGLCLHRTTFSEREQRYATVAGLTGLALAVSDSYLQGREFPSLNSVGHVNHVAIYLGLFAASLLGLIMTGCRPLKWIGYLFLLVAIVYLLLKTNSRNAVYAMALTAFAIILLLAWCNRVRFAAVSLFSLLAVVSLTVLIAKPNFWNKQLSHSQGHIRIVDEERDRIWKGAVLVAQERLLIGWGSGNFALAHTPSRVAKLIEQTGVSHENRRYLFAHHAHNLTINWLVERGLLAVIIFYFWILCFGYKLASGVKLATKKIAQPQYLKPSLAAFAALLFSVFAGIGNTTWHHEHGLLTIIICTIYAPWGIMASHSSPTAQN